MNKLVLLALRVPRVIIGLWLVLVAAAAPLAIHLDGALSGGGFTNPRAEALVAQASIEDHFGDQPNQFAVVVSADAGVKPELIAELADALHSAGAETTATPRDNPSWVSEDGTAALIVAGFGGSNTAAQNLAPVLQADLDQRAGEGASVHVTGQAALDYQLNSLSKEDATRAELIVFPLLLVVLLLVFRSVVATLLPLLMAGSALAVASGTGFLLTQVTEISNLYSNIVSMIGLAVAVDYSLFVITRFREELAQGAVREEAVRTAMATAGHSVVFSGVAVVLALASLFVPNAMAFTSIALGGIVVTLAAIALTMTALPAVLVLLGERINRWALPLPRRLASRTSRPDSPAFGRRYRAGGVAAMVAMLAAALPLLGLTVQSPVASATILPAEDPARAGLDVVDTRIGNGQLFPIQVVLTIPGGTSHSEAIAIASRAQTHLEGEVGVASVTSVASAGLPDEQLEAALSSTDPPEQLASLWHEDDQHITTRLLVETRNGPDSVRAHELVREIRADLPALLGNTTSIAVSGATAQGLDFDETITRSIPVIAALVFLLTFVMLAIAFRSLLLPLLALLFNALVVGASLGLLTLVQTATSDLPLNSVTPILLFAVMFGLSMDYMVIIIARMVETYRQGMPYKVSVRTGMTRTRSMINSAAIIMITVFLAFMTGQISIVREIGLGLAIAVALDALAIRMLVMPTLLVLIGPRAFGRHTRVLESGPSPSRA
ncbi:MMPL family transporter [Xylanimonas allomyrinae]|uniref:MMPL family transporter n=1 Tax=Xylanimonas allomyrinae TaxID=2509459 RepID=A0A4P6EL61_9MICO|nr:MMPL family transporter [Xylanimonas allomyrinae]QAY63095.1 MMPL family transporter [Xylanimonas allomyrinae]